MLWDFKAKFYDKGRNSFFLSWILRKENEVVTQLLPSNILEERRILDVGTGTGNIPSLLINPQITIGIDISYGMLQRAKSNHRNLFVINCNIVKIPLAIGVIDVVFCVGVLEYFSDFKTLFSEISQVLQNDGLFYLTYSQKNLPNFLRNILGEKIHFVQENEIIQELQSYGFQLVKKNKTFIQTQLLFRRGI
ncbi:MAG: class I SAM-dependent methyltransferase [Calditrichaeota bacterium]|nr:MAG: class I SAM-dependent methyltransferase [Calditrichota bacterium]